MVFTVSLDATPKTGTAPLTVVFSGQITDYDPATLEWLLDFRDGTVEWGQPPAPATFTVEHTYQNPGTYDVYLGAHDLANEEFAYVTIMVVELAPRAFPTKIAAAGTLAAFLLTAAGALIRKGR